VYALRLTGRFVRRAARVVTDNVPHSLRLATPQTTVGEYTSGGHPVWMPARSGRRLLLSRGAVQPEDVLLLLGSLGGLFSSLGLGLDRSLLDDLSVGLDDLGLSRCLFGL
jgi:hypothetical protein